MNFVKCSVIYSQLYIIHNNFMLHLLKMLSVINLINVLTFSPWTTTNLSTVTLAMSSTRLYIASTMHVAFSFDIEVSTCDLCCDLIAHYSLLPNNNPFYRCALYTHSLIEGHLNGFHSLLIMDKTV